MPDFARLTLAFCALTFVDVVCATPIELTQPQFNTRIKGLHTVVENFQGFPQGSQQSPLVLANGRYTGAGSVDLAPWCAVLNSQNQCLDTDFADGTFSQLPAGTTAWGATIFYASGTPDDIVQATVTGNSGVLQLDLPQGLFVPEGTFVGFYDPQGLTSASFHLVSGTTNYAFDDVTTAAVSVAPNPGVGGAPALSAWALGLTIVLTAVAGSVAVSRKRKDSA